MAVQACARAALASVIDAYRPNVLAFDTETTGLRGAVVQASAVEMTPSGNVVNVCTAVLPLPPGVVMEESAERVHGISAERIAAEAVDDPAVFLRDFVSLLRDAHTKGKCVVAHNAAFDIARLRDTLRWHGVDDTICDFENFVTCTMLGSKAWLGLRDVRGRIKNPTNVELFRMVACGQVPSTLHDATADATLTASSFVAGRRIGVFTHVGTTPRWS